MKKVKQILAVIVIILLVGMYVTTFIMSILDSTATMAMFKGCIATTIFVPVAAYCYICLHRYAMNRSKRRDDYSPRSSADDTSSSDDTRSQQQ